MCGERITSAQRSLPFFRSLLDFAIRETEDHAVFQSGAHAILSSLLRYLGNQYRFKILQGTMRERPREIIRQTCAELGVHIMRGVLARDHVHTFLSIPPKLSLANVMQRIKGRSSRRIQMKFPELRKRRWDQRFWARGYFSTTSGNVTGDVILNYLELHSKPDATGVSR